MLEEKFFIICEAVNYIASNSVASAVNGRALSSYMKLTSRYLEPNLQKLVKKNILKSTRGPKGGYVLAKDKSKISLLMIYQALEEEGASKKNINIKNKLVKEIRSDVKKLMIDYLSNKTLYDLYISASDSSVKADEFVI